MQSHRPILEIQELQLDISTQQGLLHPVDNISFKVYPGQTYALVGESGSGKSLTAMSILQLLPPGVHCAKHSKILFKGHDLRRFNEAQLLHIRGKKIGMVFQEPMTALNPVLNIEYQIKEVLAQHLHLSRRELQAQSLSLLEQVGLSNPAQYLKRYPHQLSGGQRQRVAIAIALAGDPDLLIADEPTTALDVTIQAQILNLLAKLQRQRQMGLLLITHDLSLVAKLAQKVGVMYAGKIVEEAEVPDFFKAPQNSYSQKLFAAANLQKVQLPHAAEEKKNPILIVKDINIFFPQPKSYWWKKRSYLHAAANISFTLDRGKTLAVVGESGSGKTTLAKALLRLVKISSGNIDLQAEQTKHSIFDLSLREQAKWLQIVWQDPYSSLNPRQSIKNILAEGLAVHGKQAITDTAIAQLLIHVGLPENSAQRYPHQFSGGQRQRIAIARALAANPKIVICDEPTSALDVSVQAQVLKLLRELQTELNLAYLLITHNMSVVEYLADNVAVMHLGQIVEYGSAEQILRDPQHPYTQKLLSSVLHLPGGNS